MDVSLITALGLGLTLGLRHALDADHVAAVSTLRRAGARARSGPASSARSGGPATRSPSWARASPSSGSSSRSRPSSRRRSSRSWVWSSSSWAATCSCAPSAGSWSDGREHTHADGVTHRHANLRLGPQDEGHVHLVRLGGRPFLVGLLHGLAGSAALTLLVLGTIPSPTGALLYLLVFGVGSTAGMLLLSGLVGLPLALAAPGAHRLQAAIQIVAGVGSAALGIWMLAGPAAWTWSSLG